MGRAVQEDLQVCWWLILFILFLLGKAPDKLLGCVLKLQITRQLVCLAKKSALSQQWRVAREIACMYNILSSPEVGSLLELSAHKPQGLDRRA